MRRTRILSTLGPASDGPGTIAALIDAGVDAFRLNFSHGTREGHAAVCARIREAAARAGRHIAVLQDLSGPKIRVGALAQPIDLRAGEPLTIALDPGAGAPPGKNVVTTSFEALFTSIEKGMRLLLDDGAIELEVTGTDADRVETRVTVGGQLQSHKGINVPGALVRTPALTPKDRLDLGAGIAMGVDMVAVSFVQSAADMRDAREAAVAAGAPDLPIIAKIEKPHALDELGAILDESDGAMVARGDLGIEMPLERVPAAQKRIVQAARERGRPVIVATQVLESMRSAPRPTRAEVTDAAHAVDEGADAIMLAGETAVGKYPVEAVSTLDRILREAERTLPADDPIRLGPATWSAHGHALCEAAVALAARAGADAIVAVTEGGRTARMLSALRPHARIIAATPAESIAARLALHWGVLPVVTPGTTVAAVRGLLIDRGLIRKGASVVFVSMDADLGREDANYVHVEKTR